MSKTINYHSDKPPRIEWIDKMCVCKWYSCTHISSVANVLKIFLFAPYIRMRLNKCRCMGVCVRVFCYVFCVSSLMYDKINILQLAYRIFHLYLWYQAMPPSALNAFQSLAYFDYLNRNNCSIFCKNIIMHLL